MGAPVLELGAVGVGGYEAEEHGLFNTDTPAGWAFILAVVGFVMVAVVIGRGRGIAQGVAAAFGFGLLVAGTNLWVNFLARSYAVSHSDSPIAGGVGLNL